MSKTVYVCTTISYFEEKSSNSYELSGFQVRVVLRIVVAGIIAGVAISAIAGLTYVTTMYEDNLESVSSGDTFS